MPSISRDAKWFKQRVPGGVKIYCSKLLFVRFLADINSKVLEKSDKTPFRL